MTFQFIQDQEYYFNISWLGKETSSKIIFHNLQPFLQYNYFVLTKVRLFKDITIDTHRRNYLNCTFRSTQQFLVKCQCRRKQVQQQHIPSSDDIMIWGSGHEGHTCRHVNFVPKRGWSTSSHFGVAGIQRCWFPAIVLLLTPTYLKRPFACCASALYEACATETYNILYSIRIVD